MTVEESTTLPTTPTAATGASRRPRVFILSFSNISRDARVSREAEYLSPHMDVVLAGWGPPITRFSGVEWRGLSSERSRAQRLVELGLLAIGRVLPPAYEVWFRLRPGHAAAMKLAVTERCDVYYANDWNALPAAAAGAAANNGRLIFDAHEYSPLELESSFAWRQLYRPLILRVLRRYAGRCDGSVTVSRPIADRYAAEYPLSPIVVLNAPAVRGTLPPPLRRDDTIRLIHHGNAIRERHIEKMIDAVAQTTASYRLDLMLVGDQKYIAELKQYAERRAPNRVGFPDPVPPRAIGETLAGYDMGLYLLDADMFNHAMAMPNKFFDFVAAGLGVCIGPSPAMREVVEAYGFGVVCTSTDPGQCAAVLDRLTPDDVVRFKDAARVARASLNADVELRKLITLVQKAAEQPDSRSADEHERPAQTAGSRAVRW
jgi:glycosyltransferase involved in cell wall biosynthesis